MKTKTRKHSGYRRFTVYRNGVTWIVRIHGFTNAVQIRAQRKHSYFQCTLGDLVKWAIAMEKGELPI